MKFKIYYNERTNKYSVKKKCLLGWQWIKGFDTGIDGDYSTFVEEFKSLKEVEKYIEEVYSRSNRIELFKLHVSSKGIFTIYKI